LPYVEQVQFNASEGRLNDFQPGSAITATNEGVLWAHLQLLAYARKMPRAFAIEHLKNFGIMRRAGERAIVRLRFTLTVNLDYFELSKGFVVRTSNGLEFITDERLEIRGTYQGEVSATAAAPGTRYNVPANTIYLPSEGRAYLQAVSNPERAEGGSNEETQDEAIARGFASFRDRGVLITDDDFERYATRVLGQGAAIKVVGRLAADRLSYEKGVIHIFGLNPDGSHLTEAQRSNLANAMSESVPSFLQGVKIPTIASAVYVSSIELLGLELKVVAAIYPDDAIEPSNRAALIFERLTEYLRPGNGLQPGEPIIKKELEYVVRSAGVAFVQDVSALGITYDETGTEIAENFYGDILLAHPWTAAYLLGVDIQLINLEVKGVEYQYSYGLGGDRD
jgi:hypothetical protein